MQVMDISEHSVRSSPRVWKRNAAFSLIEVTLAIGIVASAFLAVFGLIPAGMNTFRAAMDASVGAQIAQRVINEAQQTDFNVLTSSTTAVRYFDDQGNEVIGPERAIYHVNTRITTGSAMPGAMAPGGTASNNLATVTIQIANNPGNQDIHLDANTRLWSDARFPICITSALVARNQ